MKQPPYALGTEHYQADPVQEINPNSHFDRIDLRNLRDTNSDLLKKERYAKESEYTRFAAGHEAGAH